MKDRPSTGIRQTQVGWWFVWLLLLATVFITFRQPPEVMTDAGTCLLAAEQYHARKNLDFHTLIEANPANLRQDLATPITWWPASYSAIPYLLRQSGINWGQALQLVFLAGWGLGIWGWTCFFRRLLSPKVLPWVVAAFLAFRYTHVNANVYDAGEFLFWSLFPWVLLANLHGMQTTRICHWRSATAVTLAALLTVLLVTVKYSAGISAIGMAIAWVVVVLRFQVPLNRLYYWGAGAALGTLLVTLSGLLPSGNPGMVRSGIQWSALCWAPGAWTFAITDLESLVARLFLQDKPVAWLPAIGRYGDGQIALLSPITLSLLLGLWYLVCRKTPGEGNCTAWNPLLPLPERTRTWAVIVVHLSIFTIVLSGLILTGSAIHMDSRFLRPAAIAFLPWLLAGIIHALQSLNRWTRLVGYTTLGLFIMIPALYGIATATYKTVIRGNDAAARSGPLGIRHDLLDPAGNAEKFYEELQSLQTEPSTVYYLLEHALALPLAKQRVLVEHAHLRTVEHLAAKQYRGHPQGGVVLVIPRQFSRNNKLAAIQNSFIDIKQWKTRGLRSQPSWLISISEP